MRRAQGAVPPPLGVSLPLGSTVVLGR